MLSSLFFSASAHISASISDTWWHGTPSYHDKHAAKENGPRQEMKATVTVCGGLVTLMQLMVGTDFPVNSARVLELNYKEVINAVRDLCCHD